MPSVKFVYVGLSLAILMLGVGQGTAVENGRGSSAVVKATAAATRIDAAGKQTVTVTLAIEPGWHIYANPVKNSEFVPVQTVVNINAKVKPAAVKIHYPLGKDHADSLASYAVYEDKISIEAEVTRSAGDTSPLEVEVRFNACHSVRGICLPLGTEKFTLP